MKYEMIFGDEKLFDGAPKDAEAVTCVDGFNKLYYKFFGHRVYISAPNDLAWQLRSVEITHCMMSAMRRIIQEPKRLTVEDQKAGRQPEVAAKYDVEGCIVEHLGVGILIDSQFFYFRYPSGECGTIGQTFAKPLETPEEKAERLRSEWVELAFDNMMRKEGLHSTECLDRMKIHFSSAYDALLSGALSVPTKGGE